MAVLEAVKITKRFGGLEALSDIDLKIEEGELAALIGPNGAGKSTFFNVVTGVYSPTSGKILFQGEDITGAKPHQIAAKGLVRSFQATTLFSKLSVLENVEMGCHVPAKTNTFGDVFRMSSVKRKESEEHQKAIDIVKLTGLEAISGELALNLPHGYQRALGVAITLAAEPKLLCLDEPVTGMNVEETSFMMGLIKRVREGGISILLVEHTMKVVMSICDKITVLNFGRKIAEGRPAEIQNNKDVIAAYLGRRK